MAYNSNINYVSSFSNSILSFSKGGRKRNDKKYGEKYLNYQREVPMFLPRFYKRKKG